MAYFPESIMPNFIKKDISNPNGTILAADCNEHSDEIIAIEQFLGTDPASMADENSLLASDPETTNVIGIVRNLADSLNTFMDAGVQTSSGYIHSKEFITFPENSQVCFLINTPAPTDTTINVTNTLGFPDVGVISILNDSNVLNPGFGSDPGVPISNANYVPETHVEWIFYSSKTSRSFVGCQRGFLGTKSGSHAGNIPGAPTATNAAPSTMQLPIAATAYVWQYPGYRQRAVFSISALDLSGTEIQIVRAIRNRPESFDLTPGTLATNFATVTGAAKTVGILASDPNGNTILKSQTPSFATMHQLTWAEALAFYNGLSSLLKSTTDSVAVTLGIGVPVFQGKMSIQYSIGASTLNPLVTLSNGSSEYFQNYFRSLTFTQSANGRIILVPRSDLSSGGPVSIIEPALAQAVIQYRTFFVPSARASIIRDNGNV